MPGKGDLTQLHSKATPVAAAPDARLFDRAPCGLLSTDSRGFVQDINATVLKWLERPRAELIGQARFADLFSGPSQVYANTILGQMLRRHAGFQAVAVTLRSRSGRDQEVLVTAVAHDPEAPDAASYALFAADGRRSAYCDIDALRVLAQRRVSWLRQVETMVGVGAWCWDVDTHQITWSDQVFALHDLPVGIPPDLRSALAFYPEGASREAMASNLRRTLTTGERMQIDTDLITATGRRRRMRAMAEVERDNGRICRLVGVIQDITDQHQAEQRLWRVAHIDGLSGVANRSWFQHKLVDMLGQVNRTPGVHLTLMLLDLDRFKEVNDTLGHQAGDEVIRVVARRLTACLPPTAFLARIGGDEFAILLPGRPGEDGDVPGLGQAIQASVGELIPYGDHLASVSVSIGVAGAPRDADTADGLFRCADMAMYTVKRSGRGALGCFNPGVGASDAARRQALDLVRRAAAEGRIVPYYQPKVHLADRSPAGYEALARIVCHDGTVIGPSEFLPALEDAEGARIVDEHVLRGLLDDLVRWRAERHDPGPISLNVSESSLLRCDYIARLLGRLSDLGLPSSAVEIEIVETVLLGTNAEPLAAAFAALRDAGVPIALDDFGTGFASLSHLRDLPINSLKIDKSFVLGLGCKPQNTPIVRAVVDLARNLDLTVVAEGIETEAAFEFLRLVGCHVGQGFLFGPALPGGQVPVRVSGRRKTRSRRKWLSVV